MVSVLIYFIAVTTLPEQKTILSVFILHLSTPFLLFTQEFVLLIF